MQVWRFVSAPKSDVVKNCVPCVCSSQYLKSLANYVSSQLERQVYFILHGIFACDSRYQSVMGTLKHFMNHEFSAMDTWVNPTSRNALLLQLVLVRRGGWKDPFHCPRGSQYHLAPSPSLLYCCIQILEGFTSGRASTSSESTTIQLSASIREPRYYNHAVRSFSPKVRI